MTARTTVDIRIAGYIKNNNNDNDNSNNKKIGYGTLIVSRSPIL